MAKVQPFEVVAFFAVSIPFLLILSSSESAVLEIGRVQCFLFVQFAENFNEAHETCWEQRVKKHDENDTDKNEKGSNPYPRDATIEEFEYDDECQLYCVYKLTALLSDEPLPNKKDTTTIFTKGKIADDHFKVVTSGWDECLDLSTEIGKKKGWDKCKMSSHHDFCFRKKVLESIPKIQVGC